MRRIAKRCRRATGDNLIRKLPMHLVTCILDRIPIHDAARTSILSKTWRNIWQSRSDVLLKRLFMNQLISKKDVKSHQSIIEEAVTNILSAHKGPIVKFALYIPPNISLRLSDFEYWMVLVSIKGVKHLVIINAKENLPYFLPHHFTSCSELIHLMLANFSLYPPQNFQGFRSLTLVYLSHVTFFVDMSFGPQLNQLILYCCSGIQHLGCQFTHHNKNLNKFKLIRNELLEHVFAYGYGKDPISSMKECINLQRFLSSTPNMATLILNSLCLKFLDPEQAILTRLTKAMENMKTLVLYDVDFYNLWHLSNMLCLIRSSPNLQSLKILVEQRRKRTNSVELAAEQYLKSLDNKKIVLEQLHTVEIGFVENSKAEILFEKFLRASSPSLRKLYCHRGAIFTERIKEFDYS